MNPVYNWSWYRRPLQWLAKSYGLGDQTVAASTMALRSMQSSDGPPADSVPASEAEEPIEREGASRCNPSAPVRPSIPDMPPMRKPAIMRWNELRLRGKLVIHFATTAKPRYSGNQPNPDEGQGRIAPRTAAADGKAHRMPLHCGAGQGQALRFNQGGGPTVCCPRFTA